VGSQVASRFALQKSGSLMSLPFAAEQLIYAGHKSAQTLLLLAPHPLVAKIAPAPAKTLSAATERNALLIRFIGFPSQPCPGSQPIGTAPLLKQLRQANNNASEHLP
jgi:hypothetical protein